MKNPKIILVLKIALYALGFPLMAVLALVNALKVYELGSSYGIMSFVGFIIVIALGVVYALVTFLVQRSTKKSIRNQTTRLVIAAVVILLGFGIILDVAFPPILDDATDGTILYEDLANDWEGRAQVNHDLLAKWIVLNVANGNISNDTNYYTVKNSSDATVIVAFSKYFEGLEVNSEGKVPFSSSSLHALKADPDEEDDLAPYAPYIDNLSDYDKIMFELIRDNYLPYDFEIRAQSEAVKTGLALGFTECLSATNSKLQKEGVKNQLVATTLKNNFVSMDKMGYKTFSSTALPYANNKRLTIPVLVHLILDPREEIDKEYETNPLLFKLYNPETGLVEELDLEWTILDMDGNVMSISLTIEGLGDVELFGNNIEGLLNTGLLDGVIEGLHKFVADENVAGAPLQIYLGVSGDDMVIDIRPSNTVRGVLGYQNMAWLDSNGLVFMLCSVFSVHNLTFIFAGILALLTMVIGLLREKEAELRVAGAEEAVVAIGADEADGCCWASSSDSDAAPVFTEEAPEAVIAEEEQPVEEAAAEEEISAEAAE